jgi:hypothetical protein
MKTDSIAWLRLWAKSLYRSCAGSHFYGIEYGIWAGLGPIGNTEKKNWANCEQLLRFFFHVFKWKKKSKYFLKNVLKLETCIIYHLCVYMFFYFIFCLKYAKYSQSIEYLFTGVTLLPGDFYIMTLIVSVQNSSWNNNHYWNYQKILKNLKMTVQRKNIILNAKTCHFMKEPSFAIIWVKWVSQFHRKNQPVVARSLPIICRCCPRILIAVTFPT